MTSERDATDPDYVYVPTTDAEKAEQDRREKADAMTSEREALYEEVGGAMMDVIKWNSHGFTIEEWNEMARAGADATLTAATAPLREALTRLDDPAVGEWPKSMHLANLEVVADRARRLVGDDQ